ncbi:MAG: helix-turn-helix transcriptional regulator [Alphaproteobacteria bacterium]|nr:helix-turn-helix transcriptional regulator [Alphaproteobacteria bacterium]
METVDSEVSEVERHAYDGTTCRILIGSVLDLIANKWAVPIILALGRAGEPMRFTELSRAIQTITQKELTKQLRELESVGLVGRRVHPVVPPKVEYWLTGTGHSLQPVLDTLARWAAANGATLAKHRAVRNAAAAAN